MKNGDLSIALSVQGTGGSPTGPDPENRVGDQDTGSPGRPFSSGLQVPGEPEHCRARIRPAWWNSRGVFPSKVLQLHQQRWVILRVDSLALWKIINEEDAVLIPKIHGEIFSSGFLHSGFFGRGELLCRNSIDSCFVSGSESYNQISYMVTNRDRKSFGLRRKNSKSCSKDWNVDVFDPRSSISGPLRGELQHVHIFMNDGPNPLTWDAQLRSCWFSRNPSAVQN